MRMWLASLAYRGSTVRGGFLREAAIMSARMPVLLWAVQWSHEWVAAREVRARRIGMVRETCILHNTFVEKDGRLACEMRTTL